MDRAALLFGESTVLGRYEVHFWHENSGSKVQSIEVKAGGTLVVDERFAPRPLPEGHHKGH